MGRVKRIARMLPSVLRRPLSRVSHALDAARRERMLGRCLRELRERDWEHGVDTSLLDELRTAWGNTDWSADTIQGRFSGTFAETHPNPGGGATVEIAGMFGAPERQPPF